MSTIPKYLLIMLVDGETYPEAVKLINWIDTHQDEINTPDFKVVTSSKEYCNNEDLVKDINRTLGI